MKYKVINIEKRDENYLINLLLNRNIKDYNSFLYPNKNNLCDYKLLDNIEEGYQFVEKSKNKKIGLLIDCDADGYTSSAVLYNYFMDMGLSQEIQCFFHSGKQHGLEDQFNKILDSDIEYLFIPDASSNDEEYHKMLSENGIKILVLDHHEAEKYSQYACVINNQLSKNYPNKDLSGVGVVYKFCQFLDEKNNTDFADKYLDLVAIGEIGDMMNMTSPENAYIFSQGLSNIVNPGLKALVKKQEFSIKNTEHLTPVDVSFYIAPLINAIIRVGTETEKEILFKSFIDGNKIVPSTKRGHKAGDTETIAEQNARNCANARNRQNRLKDKAIDLIDIEISNNNLAENKVLLVDVGDMEIDSNLTGLIAMNLAAKYKKPTLVLRDGLDNCIKGSGRGLELSELKDFKKFLNDSGFFEFNEGHANAFGSSIKRNKISQFLEYANQKLSNVDFGEGYYSVDFEEDIEDEFLSQKVLQIGSRPDIWSGSNGNPEPLFAIKNIHLSQEDIQICGKKNDTVRFIKNGITFIMFKAEDFISKISQKDFFQIELIGTAVENNWLGNINAEIIIKDYNISDIDLSF